MGKAKLKAFRGKWARGWFRAPGDFFLCVECSRVLKAGEEMFCTGRVGELFCTPCAYAQREPF